jgi:hypothetical protein
MSPISSRKTSRETLDAETNPDDGASPAAAKQAKTTTSDAAKSPYEVQCEAYKGVAKRSAALRGMPVRDRDLGKSNKDPDEEEDDEEEEEEDDDDDLDDEAYEAKCKLMTQEQVDEWRVIIITKERHEAIEKMNKLILGDQYGGNFMMFNTSFSYELLGAFETFKKKFQAGIPAAKKFNLILGFTNAISQYDVWMHDHECEWGGERMIAGLARMWKALMKNKPEQLGIDAEFSYPGVKAFLEVFKDKVEAVDTCDDPELKFNYE